MNDDDPVNTRLPTYEVHHAGAERVMRDIARRLKGAMPPGYGFALFIFSYGDPGDPGEMFYFSSAERQSMLTVLKEFIEKQQAGGQ